MIHCILVFMAYDNLDVTSIADLETNIHFFSEEWSKKPIERIWVVPMADGCPGDYAFMRKWHGTQGFEYTSAFGAEGYW